MKIFARLLLLSMAFLFPLPLLELGLRCRTAYDNYRVQLADTQKLSGKVMAGQIVKFSGNRKMVYDLRPNLDVEFMGVPVKTNAEGFRDTDHPLVTPAGKRRILYLGDSNLFGWGVPYESCFEQVAARQLPKWDSMNMGRPGYNAAQEVECFKVYGLKYKPDVVVVNFISNDTQLPNYIQRSPTDTSASFLVDFVVGRLSRDTLLPPPPPPGHKDGPYKVEEDPSRVPDQYKDLVGWGAVERSYLELAELGKQHRFRIVLLAFPLRDEVGLNYARKAGFEICDSQPCLDKLMQERGVTDLRNSDLVLNPHDAHPNALVHQACGNFLAGWIQKNFP